MKLPHLLLDIMGVTSGSVGTSKQLIPLAEAPKLSRRLRRCSLRPYSSPAGSDTRSGSSSTCCC
jgi:hypothetical protein